jgi:hypothetical protein
MHTHTVCDPPTLISFPRMTIVEAWAVDDRDHGYTIHHHLYPVMSAQATRTHTLQSDRPLPKLLTLAECLVVGWVLDETTEPFELLAMTRDARETILAHEIGRDRVDAWSVWGSYMGDLLHYEQTDTLEVVLYFIRQQAIAHQGCFARYKAAVEAGRKPRSPLARTVRTTCFTAWPLAHADHAV